MTALVDIADPLPDGAGHVVETVSAARVLCTEAIIHPAVVETNGCGITLLASHSLEGVLAGVEVGAIALDRLAPGKRPVVCAPGSLFPFDLGRQPPALKLAVRLGAESGHHGHPVVLVALVQNGAERSATAFMHSPDCNVFVESRPTQSLPRDRDHDAFEGDRPSGVGERLLGDSDQPATAGNLHVGHLQASDVGLLEDLSYFVNVGAGVV